MNLTRLYVCLYLCLAGVFIAHAQNNVIDEVVWVVGDEAILKSDVENERLNAQYEGRRFDGDPYCVIPEELAVQKLYLHQAEIDSVEVSEQQVIQDVERRTAWLIEQIGSKEKMEEYYNKTSTQIREMLRENVRDGLTMQEMQKKIVGDIKLTPAEVRNYFSKLPQDSIPFVPTQVEVQIITREPKVKEEEIERVKKELRDFLVLPKSIISINVSKPAGVGNKEPLKYDLFDGYFKIASIMDPFKFPLIHFIMDNITGYGCPDFSNVLQDYLRTRINKKSK